MSSAILIPYYALATLSDVTATPVAYGTIVTTFEVDKALDSDRENYTSLWTGSDQPVKWIYSNGSMPTDLTARFVNPWHGIYCRIAGSIFDALDLDAWNNVRLRTSTDGTTFITQTLAYGYGDGEFYYQSWSKWKLYLATARRSIVYGEFLIRLADGATSTAARWHCLELGSDTGNGANYAVYALMDGIGVTLPDNLSLEESYSEEYSGGEVDTGPLGAVQWSGLKAEVHGARTFTLAFAECTTAQRGVLFEIFKAGCGVFPMLFMRDVTDTKTWMLCVWKKLTEREPNAGLFFVEVEVEEL